MKHISYICVRNMKIHLIKKAVDWGLCTEKCKK